MQQLLLGVAAWRRKRAASTGCCCRGTKTNMAPTGPLEKISTQRGLTSFVFTRFQYAAVGGRRSALWSAYHPHNSSRAASRMLWRLRGPRVCWWGVGATQRTRLDLWMTFRFAPTARADWRSVCKKPNPYQRKGDEKTSSRYA